MTTFCPRCGNRRTGQLRYCRQCGFDFDGPEIDADPVAPPPTPAPVTPRPNPVTSPPTAISVPPVPPVAPSAVTASTSGGPSKVKIAVGALMLLAVAALLITPPEEQAAILASRSPTSASSPQMTPQTQWPTPRLSTPYWSPCRRRNRRSAAAFAAIELMLVVGTVQIAPRPRPGVGVIVAPGIAAISSIGHSTRAPRPTNCLSTRSTRIRRPTYSGRLWASVAFKAPRRRGTGAWRVLWVRDESATV